ncbi:MAG: SDR family NAD(P)-dependent oxidoreductase, partial [Acidimicrobiia bacterium]|nr:SDR family NAD(P)-dependent oxidoreductase [Acidimicrobiia bacterium]
MVTTTALVTGANRGIGRAVAGQLAGLGHHVLFGCRKPEAAAAAAQEIEAAGGGATPIELDVASAESVSSAAATIGSHVGRLDILINNAAITYDTWQTAIDPSCRRCGTPSTPTSSAPGRSPRRSLPDDVGPYSRCSGVGRLV